MFDPVRTIFDSGRLQNGELCPIRLVKSMVIGYPAAMKHGLEINYKWKSIAGKTSYTDGGFTMATFEASGGYLFSISVLSVFDHERDIPKVPVVETY